jgi:O-antigen ligase
MIADVSAPVRRESLATLLAMAVAVLPITGLAGVEVFGELKGSASVYVLLFTIALGIVFTPVVDVTLPRPLLLFLGILFGWILLTTVVNFDSITTSAVQGRTGLNKLVTSLMVVAFGALVAVLCAGVFASTTAVERLFARPLALAVGACVLFAVPELLTWVSESGEALYQSTTGLFHTAETELGRLPGRLVSLAFEAPDLAYFCGFALPWLLFYYRSRATSALSRTRAALPAVLCGLLLLLANSRTGLVMLVAVICAECLYWIGIRRLRWSAAAIALTVVIASGALLAISLITLGEPPAEESDVSTMSRLAILTAQLSIFAQHPIFGVGLGQFAFHTLPSLPSWAWNSYEITIWFDTQQGLAPSFNVTGRIAAELGIPGLAIWYGFWSWALLKAGAVAAQPQAPLAAVALNGALFSAAAALVAGGIGNDAFRRPETWMLIALCTTYAGRTQTCQPGR